MTYVVMIEADTISDAYVRLVGAFCHGTHIAAYQSQPTVVTVRDVAALGLDRPVTGNLAPYYAEFASERLDRRWTPGLGWHLSYADRLCTAHNGISQFDAAVECLIRDKGSRRCVLTTYHPEADSFQSRPALSSIWFGITPAERLEMHTLWRSNDLLKSFPIKTMAMISLMRGIHDQLSQVYPHLKLGTYVEMINSLHVFPEDTIGIPADPRQLDLGQVCDRYDVQFMLKLWSVVEDCANEHWT